MDLIILISLILGIIANVAIARARNEEWDRWVILSLAIGPFSIPFQIFIRENRQVEG